MFIPVKKLVAFLLIFSNCVWAGPDHEWVDMESKALFETLLESKKAVSPDQVYTKAKSLIGIIQKQDKAKEEIMKRQIVYRRHKRCLLKSSKEHLDLLGKFQELEQKLKKSNCNNVSSDAVSEFSNQILAWQSERDQILGICESKANAAGYIPRDREVFMRECMNAPSYEALVTEKVGRAATSLASAVSKMACAEEMAAYDGLNIFGSVMGEVGQMGMLDPGPVGKTVAIGAKGLEGLIKVIANLVNSKWNFNKPDHRIAWVNINCSFLDLNNSIDQMGIFSAFTSRDHKEIRDYDKLIDSLKGEIQLLSVSITEVEKQYSSEKLKSEMLKNEQYLGKRTFYLYNRLAATEELLQTVALDKSVMEDMKKKGDVLKDLHKTYLVFFTHIDQAKLNPSYKKLLLPVTKDNFIRIFGKVRNSDKGLQGVISDYINDEPAYKKLISKYFKPIKWVKDDIENIMKQNPSQNNRSSKPQLLLRLEETLNIVQNKLDDIELLKKRLLNKKKNTTEGKTAIIEIIRMYNDLEQTIFGKVGLNYMKRIIKKASELTKSWYKNYTPLVEKGENICKHRKKIMTHYTELDSNVTTVIDFLKINNYIYSQDTKSKYPWVRSYKNYLSDQFFNLKKANDLLKNSFVLKNIYKEISEASMVQTLEIKRLLRLPDFYQPLTTLKKNTKVGNLILRRLLVNNDYVRISKLGSERYNCPF
jgi:hypothetical protein